MSLTNLTMTPRIRTNPHEPPEEPEDPPDEPPEEPPEEPDEPEDPPEEPDDPDEPPWVCMPAQAASRAAATMRAMRRIFMTVISRC